MAFWRDLALESPAHLLAVANVTTQLRKARRSSVWARSCQDVTPGGHAGVGVISLHGAPLSLPTLFDSSFKEFFRLGRAMEASPISSSSMVVREQRATPEKLTERFLAAVLAEAKMCCAGQPVTLVGDLNADPSVIPSLAEGVSDGAWIDVEKAFATCKGGGPGTYLPVPSG